MPTSMRASCFSRANGCSTSCRVAELFFANVTPTSCWPAATVTTVSKRASISSAVLPGNICAGTSSSGPPKRVERQALAVQADLEIVRRFRAAHDVDGVAPQTRLDDVLAVDGEVVAHEHAAARAERQPFDVIGLRAVGRHAIGADGRRDVGVAHRGARDFPRGREVTIHQRRIGAEHVGDVVEAVRLAVVRQQRVGVDLEREQIADRVAVLGAVQVDAAICGRGSGSRRRPRRADLRDRRRARSWLARPAAARRPAASCGRAVS